MLLEKPNVKTPSNRLKHIIILFLNTNSHSSYPSKSNPKFILSDSDIPKPGFVNKTSAGTIIPIHKPVIIRDKETKVGIFCKMASWAFNKQLFFQVKSGAIPIRSPPFTWLCIITLLFWGDSRLHAGNDSQRANSNSKSNRAKSGYPCGSCICCY